MDVLDRISWAYDLRIASLPIRRPHRDTCEEATTSVAEFAESIAHITAAWVCQYSIELVGTSTLRGVLPQLVDNWVFRGCHFF